MYDVSLYSTCDDNNEIMCQKDEGCGCEWTPWSSWSDCTKTCGTGIRERVREWTTGGPCDLEGENRETDFCEDICCERKLKALS